MARDKNPLQTGELDPSKNPDRIGCVTASVLGKAIEKTAKGTYRNLVYRDNYALKIAYQGLSGASKSEFLSGPMKEGIRDEPLIKDLFLASTGIKIIDIGFRVHQEIPRFGASPDGYFEEDRSILFECKTLQATAMARFIKDRAIPYEHQVQMTAQIMCYFDEGARECEYVCFNSDKNDSEQFGAHNLQSVRFIPTEEEITNVTSEVNILVDLITQYQIQMEYRSKENYVT